MVPGHVHWSSRAPYPLKHPPVPTPSPHLTKGLYKFYQAQLVSDYLLYTSHCLS